LDEGAIIHHLKVVHCVLPKAPCWEPDDFRSFRSNHPVEATLPLRRLKPATPADALHLLCTSAVKRLSAIISDRQVLFDRAEKQRSFFIAPRKEVQQKCLFHI